MSIPESDVDGNGSTQEEKNIDVSETGPDIPVLDESIAPKVKFISSFDHWVPEQMVHLPAEEEISVDYRKKTVRPVDTDIAPKGCESNNDGKPEARALQAKYPYRGNLRLNRLPVTEEDARAVSSSPFAFALSLHTRRRYSDAGSTDFQESSHQGKQEGAVVSEEVLEQINKEAEMDSPRKDHDSVRVSASCDNLDFREEKHTL